MKVAMVSARCHPLLGGIETHVHEVAGRLARRGVTLSVFTTQVDGAPESEVLGGYELRRFPAYPKGKDYYLSPALTRALVAGDFDLVHMQGVHTLLAPTVLASASRAGVPALLTFHTGGSSSRLRGLLRTPQWLAERPVLRRASRLIAVCEFEIEHFSRLLGLPRERFELIRNGCEPLPVEEGRPPTGWPIIVSVGRLERYKGHHRLLQAMPALLRSAPEAQLYLVGNGPYRPVLNRLARDLGIQDNVHIVSFGPNERGSLGRLVSHGHVVALLSEYEAHPVAVMEAVALGKSTVVADTSGLSELGRAGLCHTIALKAPSDLVATTLLEAAEKPAFAEAPPALESWEDCATHLHACYESVLS